MAEVFDLINDIALTYDGDIVIDEDNDISLINGIEWFKREVNKIIRTNLREWRSEPDIGANLNDFTGNNNTRNTAAEIRKKILEAITIDNFQFPGEFDVRVLPTSNDKLSIYITYNVIGESHSIGKLIYDLDRGISLPIYDEFDNKTQKLKPKYNKETKNKYLTSLIDR